MVVGVIEDWTWRVISWMASSGLSVVSFTAWRRCSKPADVMRVYTASCISAIFCCSCWSACLMRYSSRVIVCGLDWFAEEVLGCGSRFVTGVGGAKLGCGMPSGWGPSEAVVVWFSSLSLASSSSRISHSGVVRLPEEAGLDCTVGTGHPRMSVYLAQDMGSSLVVWEMILGSVSLGHQPISTADFSLHRWAEQSVVS